MNGTKVAMDRAGRIVLPKRIRDALGLEPGVELDLLEEDGRIVLEPPAVPMRLGRRGKGVVVVPSKSLPRLRTSQVRAVLESGRR
jgi:AbrB family looped-hinge helix DNA binding protein